MAPKRGARTEEDFLASVKIGSVPDPGPQIRRDYSPKGSVIPDLNDMVWESYTKDKTMLVAVLPGGEEWVKDQLLLAKNYLNYIHRDDVPKVDVRGLEKAAVQIVTPAEIEAMSAVERTAYRKIVPVGKVGVRFKARPPLNKGRRAQQARLREAATKPTTATRAASGGSKSGRSSVRRDDNVTQVKFSG